MPSSYYIYNKDVGKWYTKEGQMTTNPTTGPIGRHFYSSESEANDAISSFNITGNITVMNQWSGEGE